MGGKVCRVDAGLAVNETYQNAVVPSTKNTGYFGKVEVQKEGIVQAYLVILSRDHEDRKG